MRPSTNVPCPPHSGQNARIIYKGGRNAFTARPLGVNLLPLLSRFPCSVLGSTLLHAQCKHFSWKRRLWSDRTVLKREGHIRSAGPVEVDLDSIDHDIPQPGFNVVCINLTPSHGSPRWTSHRIISTQASGSQGGGSPLFSFAPKLSHRSRIIRPGIHGGSIYDNMPFSCGGSFCDSPCESLHILVTPHFIYKFCSWLRQFRAGSTPVG